MSKKIVYFKKKKCFLREKREKRPTCKDKPTIQPHYYLNSCKDIEKKIIKGLFQQNITKRGLI
jgi:hypothetical protein